jgi:hypothetical protein
MRFKLYTGIFTYRPVWNAATVMEAIPTFYLYFSKRNCNYFNEGNATRFSHYPSKNEPAHFQQPFLLPLFYRYIYASINCKSLNTAKLLITKQTRNLPRMEE